MLDYFKKYWVNAFDFKGKATRKEYWMTVLSIFVFVLILGIIIGIVFPIRFEIDYFEGTYKITGNPVGIMIYYLWVLANVIPSISIVVRRLHDIGKSGWYYLILFIPIGGPIIMLAYLVTPSVNATPVTEAPVTEEPANTGMPDSMAPPSDNQDNNNQQ